MGRRVIGFGMAVGVVAGMFTANAAATDTTVEGCFNNDTGQLRVLVPGNAKCDAATETLLSWNALQPSTRWYRDFDGDGFGDWYRFVDSPAQPPGYVENNVDCDDNKAIVHPDIKPDPGPGDRNCNGREAEDRVITWYHDGDGDGWGAGKTIRAPMSAQPVGYVYRVGDCNDAAPLVHPYQLKCHPSGDLDQDGRLSIVVGGDDCNDLDSHEYPGNPEVTDTLGHDEDCDPATGYVIPYDPNFADPRPHREPGSSVYRQSSFDQNGHLVVYTASGGVQLCDSPVDAPPGYCRGEWYSPPLYP